MPEDSKSTLFQIMWRQQVITLTNVDPYPRPHRALLGHNELIYL